MSFMKQNFEESINILYKQILNRSVDKVGLKYFTSKLMNSEMNLDEIKNEINNSEEARLLRLKQQVLSDDSIKKILDDLFIEILLRHIKNHEFELILSVYRNKKMTINDLKKYIFNLDEYIKNDYSNKSIFQKSEFFQNNTLEEINQYQHIKKFYEKKGYHTFRFPNGYVVNGKFDMNEVLDRYNIPKYLDGKTVLDIGPANGFFSFEFYKRGANKVVAIDKIDDRWCKDLNKVMHTNVKFIQQNIEKLDDEFDKFDLVFCSNVLLHISDIFGNICRIKKITKEKAILSTILTESVNEDMPLLQFLGTPDHDTVGDTDTYWFPNMAGFVRMAEVAGFSKVEEVDDFIIIGENGDNVLRQGIIHCYI